MRAGNRGDLFHELFIGETGLDNKNINIPIRQMIEVFYRAVLNRVPTEEEIDIHAYGYPAFDTPNLVSMLSSFVSSEEFAEKFSDEYQSLVTAKHQKSLINACDSYLLFPVFNEAWLPFALACCEYYFNEYAIKTIFFSDVQCKSLTYALESYDFLLGCCRCRDVEKLIALKPPSIIFSHAEIWVELNELFLEKSPLSVLFVIGDAFRNHLHNIWEPSKHIFGAIFWGFDDGGCNSSEKFVIDYFRIEYFRKALADNFILQNEFGPDFDEYDVFYVRYWSEGGVYKEIHPDVVVQTWTDTVLAKSNFNTILIIKGDERVSSGLTAKFKALLTEKNVRFIDFEDYAFQRGVSISGLGSMPVEYAYSKGLLCNAGKHYVLDSSLAYVIANHPQVKKICEIVLGVDSSSDNQFPDDCKAQITRFIEHTKNAITSSPRFSGDVEAVSPLCVKIKLY